MSDRPSIDATPPPAWRLFVHGIVRFLRLFGWRLRARVVGVDPTADGPAVAVFNHTSNVDGFVVARAVLDTTGRWVQPLVKAELFAVPLLGTLARAAGGIPVARRSKQGRAGAYDTAVERLREGATVLLAPESTITHDGRLLPMRHGAARLALQADVPVVVVTHFGCQRAFSPVARWPQRGAVVDAVVETLPRVEAETVEQLTGRIAATMETRLEELQEQHPVGGPGEAWWPPYPEPAQPSETALEQIGRYRTSMSASIAEAKERMGRAAAEAELDSRLERAREALDEIVSTARHLSEDVVGRARAGTLGEDTRRAAEQLAQQARARAEQLTHLVDDLHGELTADEGPRDEPGRPSDGSPAASSDDGPTERAAG